MRISTALFSLLGPAVAVVVFTLAMGCQQRQEGEDEGAPIDATDQAAGGGPGSADTGAGAAGGGQAGGDEVALGNQVYEANCATCHGATGAGDGPAGAGLQPKPASFTDAEWKYGGDLESVKNTINNGVPGTAMIAWKGTLSDAEIEAVAKHEISLSQGGASASAR